jgi:hypothetical protein
MRRLDVHGVHEDAFAHRLKTRKYEGCLNNEIITEMWYRLSFEDAKCFIDDDEWIEQKIEQGQTLLNPWIKLITHKYKNTITGKIRRCWSSSLRPYVQGYGCDGSTDLNIHAIANRLAEQQGLDYPSLLIRAYPGDFSATDDFSWLKDDVVLAETIIPQEIDADLALRDLQDINNYTLAEEFGIELYNVGAISTDWAEIRQTREVLKKKIERDVRDWFERDGSLT